MTKAIDLSALFTDTELPFGHPGRNFDESPAGYSNFHDRYEPPPIDPPEEEIIHYGPGDSPLCDNDCANAAYTDDPALVAGCADCLELAAEDLEKDNEHLGELPPLPAGDLRPERRRVAARRPCALPALREGRMVTNSRALGLALNKKTGARGSTCSPTWDSLRVALEGLSGFHRRAQAHHADAGCPRDSPPQCASVLTRRAGLAPRPSKYRK